MKGKVRLDSNYRNIRFDFACPSFSPSAMQLFYRLEGLETDWTQAVSDFRADYSRLPSGKYTFKIIAVDNTTKENQIIAQTSYDFEITPPWYAGSGAFVWYVAAGLLILYLSYIVVNRIFKKQRQKILKQEENRRKEELEQKERMIMMLKNEKLEAEILYKGKELAVSAMSVIQKNNVLQTLKQELQKIGNEKNIKSIIRLINKNLTPEKDWEIFESNFDIIHEKFFQNLKKRTPSLTPNDLKMCAYLRLNLSTKEIAQLTGNSVRGIEIARYRLRKKLQLTSEQNLNEFMLEFKGE